MKKLDQNEISSKLDTSVFLTFLKVVEKLNELVDCQNIMMKSLPFTEAQYPLELPKEELKTFCPTCGPLEIKDGQIIHPEQDKIDWEILNHGFTTEYTKDEPKEKSLRDAEIERLERIKFNFECQKYEEQTDIKQGDYFPRKFFNNAIDICIQTVDVEIMKLKTL